MKIQYSLLLFFALLIIRPIDAQNFDTDVNIKPEYPLVVKLSPQHIILGGLPLTGEYGAFVERRVGQKMAVEAGLAYAGKNMMTFMIEADTAYSGGSPVLGVNGFRVQGLYKFYLNRKDKNSGLFVAPHFSYSSVKYTEKFAGGGSSDYYIQGIHTDFGLIGGFRFAFGRFSMEPYIGGGYRDKHWIEKNYKGVWVFTQEEIEGFYIFPGNVLFKMGIKLGIAL